MSKSHYPLSPTHSLPTTTYPAPLSPTHIPTPKDRTRLLKSTRKLPNVLGSTSHISSVPAAPAPLSIPPFARSKELPTPRTKKSRRTGRVFTPTSMPTNFAECNSSNTSISSFDSEGEAERDGEAEMDGYVVVRRGAGATGYHYHYHLDISLPANHRNDTIKVSLVPASDKSKVNKGGKALPPPLLLRLRALPVDQRDSILSTTISVISPLSPTFPPSTSHITSNQLSQPVPPELDFPTQPRTPSPELLKKVEEKPLGPRLTPGERKARREGKQRAV